MIKANCHQAWLSLTTRKLSAFLAILGILVGTALVVALMTTGEFATEKALAQFDNLGPHLIGIGFYSAPQKASAKIQPIPLTLTRLNAILRPIKSVHAIAPYTVLFSEARYQGKTVFAPAIGATHTLFRALNLSLSKGRFLTPLDKHRNFTVIGAALAKDLKAKTHGAIIGTQIELGNSVYTVVGVLNPWVKNNFFYGDLNGLLLIPLSMSKLLNPYLKIHNVIMKISPNVPFETIQATIRERFKKYAPDQNLVFRSSAQIIKSMRQQKNIFTQLLSVIGGITLLVGGIGIMNVMLVSLSERRKEIGIRMSIGATRRAILSLFLTEASLMSLMGGIIGIVLGILASMGVAYFEGWRFHIILTPIFIGFFVAILTGIFFGLYPAFRAARLNPIETLRSE